MRLVGKNIFLFVYICKFCLSFIHEDRDLGADRNMKQGGFSSSAPPLSFRKIKIIHESTIATVATGDRTEDFQSKFSPSVEPDESYNSRAGGASTVGKKRGNSLVKVEGVAGEPSQQENGSGGKEDGEEKGSPRSMVLPTLRYNIQVLT